MIQIIRTQSPTPQCLLPILYPMIEVKLGFKDNVGYPSGIVHKDYTGTLDAGIGGLPHIQGQPKLVS